MQITKALKERNSKQFAVDFTLSLWHSVALKSIAVYLGLLA